MCIDIFFQYEFVLETGIPKKYQPSSGAISTLVDSRQDIPVEGAQALQLDVST